MLVLVVLSSCALSYRLTRLGSACSSHSCAAQPSLALMLWLRGYIWCYTAYSTFIYAHLYVNQHRIICMCIILQSSSSCCNLVHHTTTRIMYVICLQRWYLYNVRDTVFSGCIPLLVYEEIMCTLRTIYINNHHGIARISSIHQVYDILLQYMIHAPFI